MSSILIKLFKDFFEDQADKNTMTNGEYEMKKETSRRNGRSNNIGCLWTAINFILFFYMFSDSRFIIVWIVSVVLSLILKI